jgi:hypothetical protein
MPRTIVRPEMGDRNFDVYVPRVDDPLHATLPARTGIVGRPHFGVTPEGRFQVDYEPPSRAVNVVTWADRVYHAASRQEYAYPTSKRVWPKRSSLIHVALFEPVSGLLVLDREDDDPDARAQLLAWLGVGVEPISASVLALQCERTERGSVYA